MAYDNRDSIDFGGGKMSRLFGALFVPTLLGMLFNIAFVLTDGVFIGHGVGPAGLAAINLIAPIMMFINGTGVMLGAGASVVAAIHLSKDNLKAARINVTQAFWAALIIGVLLGAVLYSMPETVLSILGVSRGLHDVVMEYYLWFIPTCLLLLVQTLGMFVIRLDGSPRYAMLSNMIPACVNILLDYIFIFPCGWGLMGAALATDIGGAVGVGMVMYYMVFRTKKLKFYRLKSSITSFRLSLRNVGYMVKLGFSGFIGEVAISVMMLAGNWMFGRMMGDDGVAAYSVICYLFPVVYMIYLAVSQSAQPIVSYNFGAGSPERVREAFVFALRVTLSAGLLVSLVMAIFPPTVVSAFLDDKASAFAIAVAGLPLFAVGFVFSGLNICCIGYLQSIERASAATLLMTLRGIVLPVVAFLVMPRVAGVSGLWLAVPVSEIVASLTLPLFLFRGRQLITGK